MISDRQIANKLQMSYDTLLRWRKDKPRLYNHIKEGFELKELILDMDKHLKAISRQTQLFRLKDRISDLEDDRLYVVKRVEFDSKSEIFLCDKPYIWVNTDDEEALNILTYREDILVEDLKEADSKIYIDIYDYQPYGAEDGSEWLVSNSMTISDINEFFEWYMD